MKIILLKDVAKLGQKGEVKEVSSGYATNYLIPQKLASFATDKAVKEAEKKMESLVKERGEREEKILEVASKVKKQGLSIKEKANEKGHLFAGLSAKDLSERLKASGFDVTEDFIVLDKPIKEVGEFKFKIKAGEKEIEIELKVEVE